MAFELVVAQQASAPAIAPLRTFVATSGGDSPVTGQPLAQTEKRTTVRTGSDGTTFTSTNETRYYRDVEGRLRTTKSSLQRDGSSRIVSDTIDDPVARLHIILNATAKTATVYHRPEAVPHRQEAAPTRKPETVTPEKLAEAKKAVAEQQAVLKAKFGEFTREKLPAKQIAGVYAEGERVTVTIPAGAQGNDREFKDITETWVSPELKTMLYRSTQDPRSGTTTDEVTELSRTDPDPSLFQVPAGYTVRDITPKTAKLQ
jgi:hypothetical protein